MNGVVIISMNFIVIFGKFIRIGIMKNYICTSKGFVAGLERKAPDSYEMEVTFTYKVREARVFNTKAALKFMENHDIEGFVWKPYAEEPIRNMYTVRKRTNNYFEDDKDALGWIPEKITMTSDTDIGFLMSGKLKVEDAMTFEEAKTKALELNMGMIDELKEKISEISNTKEPVK